MTLGNSNAEGGGPICITLNGKTPTGYLTDQQGGLLVVNGSHDNAIHGDQFAGPPQGALDAVELRASLSPRSGDDQSPARRQT